MKKILALMVLGLTLLATVALTGCVEEEQQGEGYAYNHIDAYVVVNIHDLNGIVESCYINAFERSKKLKLEQGAYTVEAIEYETSRLIGKCSLNIDSGINYIDDFEIDIYQDSVRTTAGEIE